MNKKTQNIRFDKQGKPVVTITPEGGVSDA